MPAAGTMLIRGAELRERGVVDVRLAGEKIAEVGRLERAAGEPVFEARGGALLPGLHDHHLHLFSLAAAQESLRCGPPAVQDEAGLRGALTAAGGSGWLRGIDYHESVAGDLERGRLDAWLPDRPLRIQHRSGALWMLNSAGLALLGEADTPPGLERDASGRPTGRLFRGDAWLRSRLGAAAPELGSLGRRLAALGLTGLTDASADNAADAAQRFSGAAESGALPQRLWLLGGPDLPEPASPRVARGALKVLLDEARLPDLDGLVESLRDAHAAGRGVAIHCATRAETLFALAAFDSAGSRAGDRLEHASVAPPEAVAQAARLGLCVVTQPHFVAERGDTYLQEVGPEDRPWLYRCRGWVEAGVALAAGSDAPYGDPDPWAAMRAAVSRTTAAGVRLGPGEALSPERALALFSTAPDDPGGAPRRVEPGAAADLCLLERPWRAARTRLAAEDVAATWCAGRRVWER